MKNRNIKFIDLKKQYSQIKGEIDRAIQKVIDNTSFVLGDEVSEFEENFAKYCDTKYCIGVSSGTDALYLSIRALGIGPGDEVITTPFTFIGTMLGISRCGATPVFVDCNEDDFNIDPNKIESAITKRTKAIIPIHLYGQMADMDPILALAEKHNLAVIEDAAQAHGAEYNGKKAGSMGRTGCFSFYPTKNLGGFGNGGAICTNDDKLVDKLRILRNLGQDEKYNSSIRGYNCRLDSLQAAVLNVKLRYLDKWNEQRRKNAELYDELLKDSVTIPFKREGLKHVYHLYVIKVRDRDKLKESLAAKGIPSMVYYPIPLHLQKAYQELGYKKGDFPIAEGLTNNVLALPVYPGIGEDEIKFIAETIKYSI